MNTITPALRRFLDRFHHRPTTRYTLSSDRHPLQPNDFLGPDIVLYHATEAHPVLLQYLSDHYDRIDAALQEKGMRFIFFPMARTRPDRADIETLTSFINYRYPGWLGSDRAGVRQQLHTLLRHATAEQVHEGLQTALGMPDVPRPALVHRIHSMSDSQVNEQSLYSFAFLDTRDRRRIHSQVEKYLHRVRYAQDEVYLQLGGDAQAYDADDRFEEDGGQVSEEVRRAIQALRDTDNERVLVASLLYILRSLKDARPEIGSRLAALLEHPSPSISTPLSQLVVDERFRILLPDFHREVEISPLPKSFYLFMLRHPEGVLFRDLPKHRSELIEIYGRVGNRLDRSAIESSIDDLIDHRSNSVNEKCSRIKEGFLRQVDDRIARHYYITGERNQPKRVALDRSMIILPEDLA